VFHFLIFLSYSRFKDVDILIRIDKDMYGRFHILGFKSRGFQVLGLAFRVKRLECKVLGFGC
jgi:hypothetical protein